MKSTGSDSDVSWSDRFQRGWLELHPVDATFIGVHDHDARLPDLSGPGVAVTCAALRDLGAGVPDPESTRDPLDAMDRRLARGAATIRLWEHESGHTLGNPSVHIGDAVFSMMGLLFGGGVPLTPTRTEALRARMDALPDFLSQASAHLDRAPVAWTRRALRECRGGLAFLREGLGHLSADLGDSPVRAIAAVEGYGRFLEDELLARPSDRIACGAEAFQMLLDNAHALAQSADDVVAYARDELLRTQAWLSDMAPDFGAATAEEVLAALPGAHPTSDGYLRRYEETWREMRNVALERQLVTWPDAPIRYVPRPTWSRSAAPDLYFLFYRSPAAFDPPEVHDYMVAPLPEGASPGELEAFLRTNNDSVIKLNHVVHHGGIGHHMQNWHARRSPMMVGRIAAVDCASRIAMLCGGTMAEGWACYATDLMAEAGAVTPLEQYAEYAGRVRMCARAIVDVEMHHGRMDLEQAARFYRETAGMNAAAAEAESVKNSMFPGGALMYLVGTDAIHELRRDLMRVQGEDFELRRFHDAFLSYGSVPVRLVADEMRRRATAGLPLGAHDRVEAA